MWLVISLGGRRVLGGLCQFRWQKIAGGLAVVLLGITCKTELAQN